MGRNKADIQYKTESFADEIQKIVPSTVAYGKPEVRLSMVNQCYQSARRDLFHSEASVEEEKNEINKVEAMEVFASHNLDASKVDQRIFEKFLANGLQSDLDCFVEDYFGSLGDHALNSFLFRPYLVLS